MHTLTSLQKRTAFSRDFRNLAESLTMGALRELELTPKPGLVDRLDNGSHPDLSYELMELSVMLLPRYYEELALCLYDGGSISELRAVGMAAEKQMMQKCQSNTHKGFIFLSGLVLLSHIVFEDIRTGISELSEEFFSNPLPESNGSSVRRNFHTGGIKLECLEGLPSVFEAGIPALNRRPDNPHYALACIMERADDSTSIHRCGMEGLKIVRRDGAELKKLIEEGEPSERWLAARNEYYRSINLTMGGCADLLALSFALKDFNRS